MAWRQSVRRIGSESVRYLWVYLLIASVFTILLGDNEPSQDHLLLTWITCFAMIFSMVIGTNLTDELLAERLAGPKLLSFRGVLYTGVVVEGWVVLGVAVGALLMRPFAPAELIEFVAPIVRIVSLFGAPMTVVSIRTYESYQELRIREVQAQRAALGAQVQALQARIQPHFLFNCLNTVASLIEEDPKRAEAAVLKLSDLFRYSLDASSKRFVSLTEELEVVEGFLEIETLRHPDRLKVALHVEAGAHDFSVPPLFLQPIVENAVLHGIAPRREGGRLEVEVRRDGPELYVRVEDDGPGPGGSEHRGAGTALADLRERLALLYGGAATLTDGRGPLGGYRVELRLPQQAPDGTPP